MSTIINKIFVQSANRTEKNIKENATQILEDCILYQTICNKYSGDDRKDNLIEQGFQWLFDDKGKPNKKGICKPIMSGTMRNNANGMQFIAEHADEFIAWAKTDEKTGVNSFTGIKTALKPEKSSTNTASENTGDSDAENVAASDEKNDGRTMSELYENFLIIWKNAGHGDSIAFSEFVATIEAGKIADRVDARPVQKAVS